LNGHYHRYPFLYVVTANAVLGKVAEAVAIPPSSIPLHAMRPANASIPIIAPASAICGKVAPTA